MFRHPKCSHSPPEIVSFRTRNFAILYPKLSHSNIFSHLPQRLLSTQAISKRNFYQKFPDDFFSHNLPNKNLSPPNSFGKCSGLRDFYSFLLFLSKRSRKVPVRHDLLYDIALLTYKIYIPHIHSSFSFPDTRYRRVPSQKKPWLTWTFRRNAEVCVVVGSILTNHWSLTLPIRSFVCQPITEQTPPALETAINKRRIVGVTVSL